MDTVNYSDDEQTLVGLQPQTEQGLAEHAPVEQGLAEHAPVEQGLAEKEPQVALAPLKLAKLPQIMRDACQRAGWPELMPVQQFSLPYLLQRQDLMVQSRTGSGKTGAYLLPLLQTLKAETAAVQGLVLVPTRELASQVEQEAKSLLADTGLEVAAVYGGVGYDKQVAALRRGAALVVGTPGRILDHLMRRTLSLDKLQTLVFDEADRMLSIGFYPDMKEIQRYLPASPRRPIHTTLFSATYPPHVLRLAGEFLREPELLSMSSSHVHVAEVEHAYCECQPMDKDRTLLRLIETENPSSAIIFCNTKANVHYVTAVLQGFGLCADELSADLSQNRREAVLSQLRKGELRFLVATDVAARGIDIPDLSHVFLYEPPEDRESYIHRAGRTGRAGAAGVVVSLVDIMQKLELNRIAQFYHIRLNRIEPPTEDDVARALGERVQALLESRFRQLPVLTKQRLERLLPLARHMSQDPEQLPLLALLLDSAYQHMLNPAVDSLPPARTTPAPRPAQRKESHDENRGERNGRNGNTGSTGRKKSRSRSNGEARDTESTTSAGGAGVNTAEQPSRSAENGEGEASPRPRRKRKRSTAEAQSSSPDTQSSSGE